MPNGSGPTPLVDNLPVGACVEIPVWVSSKGLESVRVGPLPSSVAMLTGLSSQIEEMAVEGILEGDPRKIFQAILHDPLASSVLSMAEIREMVNEMFAANVEHLPTFSSYEVEGERPMRLLAEPPMEPIPAD